jgi:hypothetical protein
MVEKNDDRTEPFELLQLIEATLTKHRCADVDSLSDEQFAPLAEAVPKHPSLERHQAILLEMAKIVQDKSQLVRHELDAMQHELDAMQHELDVIRHALELVRAVKMRFEREAEALRRNN